MTDISNCCGGFISVHCGGEGTSYYICDACGKPCDPATPKDRIEQLEKENAELKAEVERLKCFPSAHEYDRINRETATREKYIADLKAELEAVRKELASLKHGVHCQDFPHCRKERSESFYGVLDCGCPSCDCKGDENARG